MAASTAGSPQRVNGPTVETSTSPSPTSARTESGRDTSATAISRPPSSSPSERSRSTFRAASTGRAPRATSASATSLPVYPVAPKTTIRDPATAWTLNDSSPSGATLALPGRPRRSEEHTSELQSHVNLVCRLPLEKKNIIQQFPLAYRRNDGILYNSLIVAAQ